MMKYDNNKIKQFHVVEYLGCCLDANLSGECCSHIDKMSF